jgi:hypothetical protein
MNECGNSVYLYPKYNSQTFLYANLAFDRFFFFFARVQFLQFVTAEGLIRFISRAATERNESSSGTHCVCGNKKKIKESGARVWVRPRRRAKVRLLGLTHGRAGGSARGVRGGDKLPRGRPRSTPEHGRCIYTFTHTDQAFVKTTIDRNNAHNELYTPWYTVLSSRKTTFAGGHIDLSV